MSGPADDLAAPDIGPPSATVATTPAASTTAVQTGNAAVDLGGVTTTERFFRQWDRPGQPLAIRVRMHLSGAASARFQRDHLAAAFAAAVNRHPMLQATLVDGNWQPAEPPILQFDRPPALPQLSLATEPGLSAVARETATATESAATIDIDFHHVATDGQGARQFLLDWFADYTARCEGRDAKLVRLEPERLADRGTLTNPPGVAPPSLGEGLSNLWTTVRGRTVRLPRSTETRRIGLQHAELLLSADETAAVRQRMRTDSVTANDLGVALTLAVCAELMVSRRGWLTIANPVDLRKPSDRRLPACNRLGFAFVRRPVAAVAAATLDKLLPAVQEQMRYVKDGYIGAEFIRGLDLVQPLGLVGLMRRAGWFVPTAQFTCLGDTTRGTRHGFTRETDGSLRFGDFRLDAISGFAPLGPGVPLSFGQCETAARMTFTAVTDGIDADDALARLRQHLDHWVAASPVDATTAADSPPRA